ncbi:NACHT domain-containing protein [Pseudoalteromonas fuliginea]|uniref:NACHT domain-containing protein n=1 Tax=Pseudoalteromonas fuliginea TaxID=1872678 RepID=A0ABQ6RF13_9GAMM|nr:hypothetical protein [Pseudoalteromonas fuliginea]KAA1152095.1 hypothetical protein EU509_14965 [Pseudoalteromonas fuliginea]KAA1166192.1 hypothetical protein EUZ79_14955 [Pseudoalteromonas fuliginea]
MTVKPNSSNILEIPRAKKKGGGAAVGGGINFQANVTTIVGIHILCGVALNWLEGLCTDKPVAVWAESEGPGDDLRIELEDNTNIEVQAKKGLRKGIKLWDALYPMAEAIHNNDLSYGVLAIASDSSKTIRENLAKDIELLGQGRTDSLTQIGKDWANQLKKKNIPVQKVSRCIRIKVFHTFTADNISISWAKELLRSVCAKNEDIDSAWDYLYRKAVILIENRGRWTLQDLVRLFQSSNIAIREDNFPASVFERYSKWMIDSNDHFFITGIKHKIPLTDLLPMSLEKSVRTNLLLDDAQSALDHYFKRTERKSYGEEFSAISTARFKMHVVVIAGPGLGKSTMIKQLAYQYAQDGFLVLKVVLKTIAVEMKRGASFSELLLKHGLDGSPISPDQIKNVTRHNWVILADGLDECGNMNEDVAVQIHKFSLGNPYVRIVVTTRPIGYDTAVLSDWVHYCLLPPKKEEGESNLKKLVYAVVKAEVSHPSTHDHSNYQLDRSSPRDDILISPQLLGMSASLIYQRRELPRTRLELYTKLFEQFELHPIDSAQENADLYSMVINIIGWELLITPLMPLNELIDSIAKKLVPMMGKKSLELKSDIRLAIAHWERVGLIEKVFHDGIAFLTFIHKTFCEFAASRFLVNFPEYLLGDMVDDPEKQEVINFAVRHGLADNLIELYLSRHTNGHRKQLQPALALLGNQGICVSDKLAQELVRQSFKVIDNETSDKFSIGIALSDVGSKASHFVETIAISKITSANPAIKLIAWAIHLKCNPTNYEASTLSVLLTELIKTVKPSDIYDIVKKRDRSDLELLQIIALEVLKIQPKESAKSYAEQLTKNDLFKSWKFRIQIDSVLWSKKIDFLEAQTSKSQKYKNFLPYLPIQPRSLRGPNYIKAIKAIAQALINENTKVCIEKKSSRILLNFSGFIEASGFIEITGCDLMCLPESHGKSSLQSILKVVASLMSVDRQALEEDAIELLNRIDSGQYDSMHSIYKDFPAIDIDSPNWKEVSLLSVNIDEIIQGFFHPSSWINYLAMNICVHHPMSLEQLEDILQKTEGYSMRCIVGLVEWHYPKEAIKVLLKRIEGGFSADISAIFDFLTSQKYFASAQTINTTLKYLHSSDSATAQSAADFLSFCNTQGIVVGEDKVVKAIAHWGEFDDFERDINSLKRLLDTEE